MTARKSERLLNLLITLLVSRTYVTKDKLRNVVEAYREASDDAFEKMFERDKDDLRALGVPIEVGGFDPMFEDEKGYRISRGAFELPDIDLDPQEAAVVGLAARVWQHAGLAAATSDALVKLKAAGVSVDREALDVVQPQLTAEEPAFEPLWDATRTRTPVRFTYRRVRRQQGRHPPPAAVGRGVVPRPLVRRRSRHRPRRATRVPALPGAGRRQHGRQGRAATRCPRAPTCGR